MIKIGNNVEHLFKGKIVDYDVKKIGNRLTPIVLFKKLFVLEPNPKMKKFRQKFITFNQWSTVSAEFLKLGRISKSINVMFSAVIYDYKKRNKNNNSYYFKSFKNFTKWENKKSNNYIQLPNSQAAFIGMIISNKHNFKQSIDGIDTSYYINAYNNWLSKNNEKHSLELSN